MIEIKAKTRKWGNSIGVIIPKGIAKRQKIGPQQDITLLLEKSEGTAVRDIFGTNKLKISADKALREIDGLFGD